MNELSQNSEAQQECEKPDLEFDGFSLKERTPKWFGVIFVILCNIFPLFMVGIFCITVTLPTALLALILESTTLKGHSFEMALLYASPLFLLGLGVMIFYTPITSRGNKLAICLLWFRWNRKPSDILCQVTYRPRRSSLGFLRFLNDADDIGLIRIENDEIRFLGDHAEFSFRAKAIGHITFYIHFGRSMGPARRTGIFLNAPDSFPIKRIEIGELESRTIFGLWKMPVTLHQAIESLISENATH